MDLKVTVTGSDAVREELQRIGRQAPFAMSLALNHTANEAQRQIRTGLAGFTLRRKDFVERTIYRNRSTDFSTKQKFSATVRIINKPDAKGRIPDFLAQHEDGGQKTARSGSTVAIPMQAVLDAAGGPVIPKRLRPSGLRLNPQVRKVVTPSGVFLVRNRLGKGKGRLDGWRTEFLYRLKPSVPIRPRLRFHQNAERAINESYERIALNAIDQSIGREVRGLL